MWKRKPVGDRPPPVNALTVFLTGLAVLFFYYRWKQGYLTQTTLIYFVVLIPSIILHEISHGAIANFWGDPTAKNAGRLTLNPLRHIDLVGTLIMPAVLALLGAPIFGYAKPVPVNTSGMSRNKSMMVGLIGPISNIAIAVIAAVGVHLAYKIESQLLFDVALQLGIANVVLAVFNLIPIPPLDGASVVERFLPDKYVPQYLQFRQYAMFLLVFIMLSGALNLSRIFSPALQLWGNLLP